LRVSRARSAGEHSATGGGDGRGDESVKDCQEPLLALKPAGPDWVLRGAAGPAVLPLRSPKYRAFAASAHSAMKRPRFPLRRQHPASCWTRRAASPRHSAALCSNTLKGSRPWLRIAGSVMLRSSIPWACSHARAHTLMSAQLPLQSHSLQRCRACTSPTSRLGCTVPAPPDSVEQRPILRPAAGGHRAATRSKCVRPGPIQVTSTRQQMIGLTGLGIQGAVVVDVRIAQRAAGHGITAHADRRHRADLQPCGPGRRSLRNSHPPASAASIDDMAA
jgi:hypothetical protein